MIYKFWYFYKSSMQKYMEKLNECSVDQLQK